MSHFEYQWSILHADESLNRQGCEVGVLLEGPNQIVLEQSLRFGFKAFYNQSEYDELLADLWLVKKVSAKWIKCWSDSKVASGQINEGYQVKEPQLLKYWHAFMSLKDDFEEIQVEHIDRDHNDGVDK